MKIAKKIVISSVATLLLLLVNPQQVKGYNCDSNNRSPECSLSKYPTCHKATTCTYPNCSMTEYVDGAYQIYCAEPVPTATPTPLPAGFTPIPTASPSPIIQCPVCPTEFHWHTGYRTCCKNEETPECATTSAPSFYQSCSAGQPCVYGTGCGSYSLGNISCTSREGEEGINTAIGCIPTGSLNKFVAWFLSKLIFIASGIAFLLMAFGALKIITSAGSPESIQAGKELITSSLAGLVFIILSLFLLKLIGVDILQIPGFGG